MTDDQALVAKVLRGEESALRVLIQQHQRLVAHMVGRLIKGNEDREEICQDVFLKVYEKLPDFAFQSRLSTWIGTIAYRHAINHLRKQRMAYQEIPEEGQWEEAFVEREDPGEILIAQDEHELVLRFLDRLPEQYKAVLTLYHLDGKNYAEIGTIMDMPEGTVKNYLFRGRSLLKEKVTRYFHKEII